MAQGQAQRNFRLGQVFNDRAAATEYLEKLRGDGWVTLSAPGSKLPKGEVLRCVVVGYRTIESDNTSELLLMYDIQANVGGQIVNDTVMASEVELINVGEERFVENFVDNRNRLLNRFVVQSGQIPGTAASTHGGTGAYQTSGGSAAAQATQTPSTQQTR